MVCLLPRFCSSGTLRGGNISPGLVKRGMLPRVPLLPADLSTGFARGPLMVHGPAGIVVLAGFVVRVRVVAVLPTGFFARLDASMLVPVPVADAPTGFS